MIEGTRRGASKLSSPGWTENGWMLDVLEGGVVVVNKTKEKSVRKKERKKEKKTGGDE